MLTRNFLILCSLAVLLVEADLDTVDAGSQAMSTDQDSTSDEVPTTESMNVVSPDQSHDEPQYYIGATADTSGASAETGHTGPQANDVTGADGAKSSTEDQDEDENPDSDEIVKAVSVQQPTKSQKAFGKRSKTVVAKKRTRAFRRVV